MLELQCLLTLKFRGTHWSCLCDSQCRTICKEGPVLKRASWLYVYTLAVDGIERKTIMCIGFFLQADNGKCPSLYAS